MLVLNTNQSLYQLKKPNPRNYMPQAPVISAYKDRHQFSKSASKPTLLMRPAIIGLIVIIINGKFHPITIMYFMKP